MKKIKNVCLPIIIDTFNEVKIANEDEKILYGDSCDCSSFEKYLPLDIDDKFSGKYRGIPFCVVEQPNLIICNGAVRKNSSRSTKIYICSKK